MQPLAAMIQPLVMQYAIDITSANRRHAIALLPRRAKATRVLAPAEEAGTVARGERGGLVEKEQFGPAPLRHHVAAAAAELQDAGQPHRRRPALSQESFSRRIMDDAAIADKEPAMRRRDDVA